MSETAPERQGGGVNLSKKYGPLPAWGWMAVAGVAAVGYWWWKNRQSQSASTSTTASGTGATAADDASSIATLQSEIQQLQGAESTELPPGTTYVAGSGGGGHPVGTPNPGPPHVTGSPRPPGSPPPTHKPPTPPKAKAPPRRSAPRQPPVGPRPIGRGPQPEPAPPRRQPVRRPAR